MKLSQNYKRIPKRIPEYQNDMLPHEIIIETLNNKINHLEYVNEELKISNKKLKKEYGNLLLKHANEIERIKKDVAIQHRADDKILNEQDKIVKRVELRLSTYKRKIKKANEILIKSKTRGCPLWRQNNNCKKINRCN